MYNIPHQSAKDMLAIRWEQDNRLQVLDLNNYISYFGQVVKYRRRRTIPYLTCCRMRSCSLINDTIKMCFCADIGYLSAVGRVSYTTKPGGCRQWSSASVVTCSHDTPRCVITLHEHLCKHAYHLPCHCPGVVVTTLLW